MKLEILLHFRTRTRTQPSAVGGTRTRRWLLLATDLFQGAVSEPTDLQALAGLCDK